MTQTPSASMFDESRVPDERGFFSLHLEGKTWVCRLRLREVRRFQRLLKRPVSQVLQRGDFDVDEACTLLMVALEHEFSKRRKGPEGTRDPADILTDERVEEMIANYAPPARDGEEVDPWEDLASRLMIALGCAMPGGRKKVIRNLSDLRKRVERSEEAERQNAKADPVPLP